MRNSKIVTIIHPRGAVKTAPRGWAKGKAGGGAKSF